MIDSRMHRLRAFFNKASILFILLLLVPPAIAEQKPELTNSDCLDCHGDPAFTGEVNGKEISLFVDADKFKKSVHGGNDCTSCHADITEIPHAEALQKVQCASCHGDIANVYSQSTHGKAFALKIPEAPDCVTCHGTHDILPKSDLASKTHLLHEIELCTSCHMNPKIAGKYNLPAADRIEAYKNGIHGRGVLKKRPTRVADLRHVPYRTQRPTKIRSSVQYLLVKDSGALRFLSPGNPGGF